MFKSSVNRIGFLSILTIALQAETGNLTSFPITDPVFGMTAYTISAPESWTVEGTVLPPPSCSAATPVVIKASSADRTMGVDFLPGDPWSWGGEMQPRRDCTSFDRDLSAKEYLTYFTRATKLGFVRDVPYPESRRFEAEHPGQTVDQAAARVRYSVGGKQMEAMLLNTIICFDSTEMGPGGNHTCTALVQKWFAPYGRLDAMIPTFVAMTTRVNPQWMDVWTNAMHERLSRLSEKQTHAMLRAGDIAEQARMAEHAAFMTSQQRGADRRDIQFKEGQFRKQSNNDDLVDHILGCSRSYGDDGRISIGNCPDRQTY